MTYHVNEASVAPNKQGAGILVRTKRLRTREHNDCRISSNLPNEKSEERSSVDDSKAKHLKFPQPGDICIIQYRCYTLSFSENGRHVKKKLVQCTNDFEEDGQSPLTFQRAKNNQKSQLPLEFEVGKGHVLQGLEAAVQRMAPSAEIIHEVTIPHLYAYGHQGHLPEIPPQTDLYFEIKLERVEYKRSSPPGTGWWFVRMYPLVHLFRHFWAALWPWSAPRGIDNNIEQE
jgi:FKBP-type peptidyl-prolyl cis-trans isomerase